MPHPFVMETFAQLVGRKKNTSPGLRAEEGIDETILTHTLTNSVCQEKITNSILGQPPTQDCRVGSPVE